MEIKKFVNGKVKLSNSNNLTVEDLTESLFWSDMYLNQIGGYMYLVDFNTNKIYDLADYYSFSSYGLNSLIDTLKKDKKVYLYPVDSQTAKELFIDLENGF